MIDYEIEIDAPASLVFSMLIEGALLTEWMAAEAEVDARPGGALRWVYENGDIVSGTFIELQPPHRLIFSYGWEKPSARGIPPGSTKVEITLNETGSEGPTLLRLVHLGLPAEVTGATGTDEHLDGWRYFLGRLAARAKERGR